MELMQASRRGDLDRVKCLCDEGADVNFQDSSGRTALMLTNGLRVVNELCDRGANLEIVDNEGRTALSWCIMYDDILGAKELFKRGAKPVYSDGLLRSLNMPLFTKQAFRRNVLVLVGHIQIELLRSVHQWI